MNGICAPTFIRYLCCRVHGHGCIGEVHLGIPNLFRYAVAANSDEAILREGSKELFLKFLAFLRVVELGQVDVDQVDIVHSIHN